MLPESVRRDFPAIMNNPETVYLDSACMALKPKRVIDAILDYYTMLGGCGGRSSHRLAIEVTERTENAREKVAAFFNADYKEIVFTRNTTEGLNIVARGLGLGRGDRVLTTDKEHNSNLIPWQKLSEMGVKHDIVPSNPDGSFDMEAFKERMEKGVKVVSMVHTSNLDGYTIPAKEIGEIAHDYGALFVLDSAQSAPHHSMDVRELDVDFMAFSIHKMAGPTGIGALYGKHELLGEIEPLNYGGGTIDDATYASATLLDPPERFEAGLQDYAGIIGAGEAVEYLRSIGMHEIEMHETALNRILTRELDGLPHMRIIGPHEPELRGGIFNFTIEGLDSMQVSVLLDEKYGILLRGGRQCVNSWYNSQGIEGGVRASFYIYNTEKEIRYLAEAITEISGMLGA